METISAHTRPHACVVLWMHTTAGSILLLICGLLLGEDRCSAAQSSSCECAVANDLIPDTALDEDSACQWSDDGMCLSSSNTGGSPAELIFGWLLWAAVRAFFLEEGCVVCQSVNVVGGPTKTPAPRRANVRHRGLARALELLLWLPRRHCQGAEAGEAHDGTAEASDKLRRAEAVTVGVPMNRRAARLSIWQLREGDVVFAGFDPALRLVSAAELPLLYPGDRLVLPDPQQQGHASETSPLSCAADVLGAETVLQIDLSLDQPLQASEAAIGAWAKGEIDALLPDSLQVQLGEHEEAELRDLQTQVRSVSSRMPRCGPRFPMPADAFSHAAFRGRGAPPTQSLEGRRSARIGQPVS